jgi:hypothetical protein
MGSWVEELERRAAVARERIEDLGRQIAELTGLLAAEQERLSRLEITRETMAEIVAGTGGVAAPRAGVGPEGGTGLVGGSPVGVVTVPVWRPGMDAGVLPVAYRDILEVLTDAGQPLRAKEIAAGLGLPLEAAKVEGLRSKLKRLVERGWLSEPESGVFALAAGAAVGGMPGLSGPDREEG